jgi:hypothetical protein
MKTKNLISLMVALLVGLYSCTEEFFDINQDPNGPTSTTPDQMMPNVIQAAMTMMATTSFVTTTITQHRTFNQNSGITTGNNWLNFDWAPYALQNNYWQTGSNNELMMQFAKEEGSPHYLGAGQLIKAFAFSVTLDFYGEIYYTQAFQGITQPMFDDPEFVYGELLKLCEEGIANLQNTDNFRPLVDGDIMYNGNVGRWIRFGHAIKARLLNHLTKKSTYDATLVLEEVDQSFTSSEDDAGFIYPDGGPFENKSNDWSDDYFFHNNSLWHEHFVDYLKGIGTGGVLDPRLPLIINPASDGEYRGVRDGISLDGLPSEDLVSPTAGKYYTLPETPYPLMTYEELKFIEAEAAFLANLKDRSYMAFVEGIQSNMEKVGVDDADIDNYLSNSDVVPQSPSDLTIADIMLQKYLALPLNPEIWVDMRRYDYSTDVYPLLMQPENANPTFGGDWIRRMQMFNTEIQYNPEEVERVGGFDADYMAKPVWWDTSN